MRYLAYILLIIVLYCGCATLNGIFNPPSTEPLPPGVTPDIVKLHKSLVKMQEQTELVTTMTMPKPSFGLSWHDTNPPTAGVTEYRIYRGIGIDPVQATQLIGVVLFPDTVFVDSTATASIRYVYRITCYAGNSVANNESAKSNPMTAAWVNLGPLVPYRDRTALYDSIYTGSDLLVITVPSYHPSDVQWAKTPVEKVTWVGKFDTQKNCSVDLSDLSYYATQVYNKPACDSASVGH